MLARAMSLRQRPDDYCYERPHTPESCNALGRLEKSAIERIRSQDGADAGMSLNCCVSLEFEFFEVPFIRRNQAMSKKIVVVWANCQGGSLSSALRDMHSEKLDVHWFMNYEFIKNGLELPAFMKSADLFLYQNYRPQEVVMYDLDWISRNILPANCQKVSFPTLHSITLQFCHDYHEPNNTRTQGPDLPHGAFFMESSRSQIFIPVLSKIPKQKKSALVEFRRPSSMRLWINLYQNLILNITRKEV